MKRAESNEHYAGLEAGIVVEREGQIVNIEGAVKLPTDKLIGGWAKVFRDDRKVPVKVQISYEEFSKGQATWKQMPMNMIRKTAIVNAMREAFPGNLGNMYTEEESDTSGRKDITQEVDREVHSKANQEIIDIQSEPTQDGQSKGNKEKYRKVPLSSAPESESFDPASDFEQATLEGPGF
jgi:hypothetical protein